MSKQQVRTRKKVTAVQQQHYKAVALHDEGLTIAVRAPETSSTGNVNAGAIFRPKGRRISKGAQPLNSQPADKCPEVEIIPEVEREKHTLAMGDAELCDFITKRLSPARQILRDSIPYLQEVQKRFSQPGQRVPVAGKPTWGKWIKQNPGFSDRHVRRLLAGEQNQQQSRSKKPVRRTARTSAISKGNVEALASQYGRYGYRRITALLKQAGWGVGKDRVERIWRREGLKVPQRQKPRRRLWLNDGSCVRLRPERPRHVWSHDFVSAATHDGRSLRLLTRIDKYTPECLAIRVAHRMGSQEVIETPRVEYDTRRPHSALGCRPPVPAAYSPLVTPKPVLQPGAVM